jgi:ribonuclease P protein component
VGPITLRFTPDPSGRELPGVAYAVGRSVGGAVVRNRLRRRLRAVVAAHEDLLRPGSYLFGAEQAAVTLDARAMDDAVSTALRRVSESS